MLVAEDGINHVFTFSPRDGGTFTVFSRTDSGLGAEQRFTFNAVWVWFSVTFARFMFLDRSFFIILAALSLAL